ncbi:hypothetical protein [Achromobacter arsenitoxydans]|nr:hypothetical protein [Achromobacter arsenitoxydans]
MMRRVCRCCLLLAVALTAILARPLHAQDAPVLRVTASAPAEGQTGATIKLQLEVMTSTWFTQPPQLPKLDLPGVTVTPPSGHGELVRDEQNGQSLNGLRYTYLLSVESAGALHIPALSVTAQLGPAGAPVTAESAPLTLQIKGAARLGNVVGDLSVTQSFTLTPDPLVQGGRITRSVTQRADGVQPMLLPPAPLGDVPHFKRYPREPEVVTLTDGRGGFVGAQRIDQADYVAQESGSFALPPLTLHWTDARSGSPKNQTLPGRQVDVAAAQTAPPPFSLQADLAALRHGLRWAIPGWAMPAVIGLAAAGLALWLGRAYWQRLARALGAVARRARTRWLVSEPRYWRAWQREAHAAPAVLSDCYRWIRRSSGAAALRDAVAPLAQDERQFVESTLRHAYGMNAAKTAWRAPLASRSRVWRRAWRKRPAAVHALPKSLNPLHHEAPPRTGDADAPHR